MQRQGFDQYMPGERKPSVCGCGEEEDDTLYVNAQYNQDMQGVPVRVYGGSGGKFGFMTIIIAVFVALFIGYMCKEFDFPMRIFTKGGGGGGGDMPQ